MSDVPTETTAVEPLDLRKLAIQTAIGLAAFLFVLLVIGIILHEPLVALGERFVESMGGVGVMLGFLIPDAFTVPLPGDAFSTVGLLGGMTFWEVVAWGSIGSIGGGVIGYGVGRALGHMDWFERFMERRGAEVRDLVRRYGTVALAAAALTPLPYSLACWAAGALEMDFGRFCAVSMLRAVRVAGYLYLIQLGFWTVI